MSIEIGQAVMINGEVCWPLMQEINCSCGRPMWMVATENGGPGVYCEELFGPAEGADPMSMGVVFSSIVAIGIDRAAVATGLEGTKQVAVLAGLLGRMIGLKVQQSDCSWVCEAAHSIMTMSATKTSAAQRGDLAPGGTA